MSGVVAFLAALLSISPAASNAVKAVWPFGGGDESGSWSELRIERPVALTDGQPRRVSIGAQSELVRSTVPQVDFTVRNEGEGRIPLGRVKVEVTDSQRITACEQPQGDEGGIPVNRSFFVDLPELPAPEERVVLRQLHQEVLPERAARFRLYFRSLAGAFAADLFAVNISLVGSEAGQRLEVGRFLLSLPGSVAGGAFLPESTASLEAAAEFHSLPASTWCFRRNRAVIHSFLSLHGERAPSMAALSKVKPPPGWDRLADHRSAAASVGPLLRSGDFFLGPALALFAAHQAGDRSLLAATRRRAIAILRRSVEGSLDGQAPVEPEYAVADARLLRELSPSSSTGHLVARTEAALRESEATVEG